eukprot:05600.XXX_90784_92820_1 [CDS] Oithona nana genome sequencing.
MPSLNNQLNAAPATQECFLCQTSASNLCPHCGLVYYCSTVHFNLHRVTLKENGGDQAKTKEICLPYKVGNKPNIGRVLIATRTIKPMELILIDPGTVTGPNYTTKPMCLDCLKPVNGEYVCPQCGYPMCNLQCSSGRNHSLECEILSRCTAENRPKTLQIDGLKETNAYAIIAPLRLLLLLEANGDEWMRSNQLMDHQKERISNAEEWTWYEKYIVNYFLHDLDLLDRFTPAQIHRAIGLINVNAVALKFPMNSSSGNFIAYEKSKCDNPEGKGLYPIFAIGTHYCICNSRYSLDPQTRHMYVRARMLIPLGDEISVQYLSALYGNFKRRKKIKDEWYFDCTCRRCSDPVERGTFISAIKCPNCGTGNMLPENSLNYDSEWKCSLQDDNSKGCGYAMNCDKIDKMVDEVEEDLNSINTSGNFDKYSQFIKAYSDILLHKNHYLIITAARNLVQWYTYRNGSINDEELREKQSLCKQLDFVLARIDPGYSEIRSFVQKELHFATLMLIQRDLQSGVVDRETYLETTRISMKALDELERYKNLIKFNWIMMPN